MVPFLSAVHLDENVYEGALNFNPWRWMDPQNEVSLQTLLIGAHTQFSIWVMQALLFKSLTFLKYLIFFPKNS